GRWIGKVRRMSAHFRSGIDTMIREAELEDAEKEWRERNARIMAETSGNDSPPAMEPLPQQHGSSENAGDTAGYDARAEAAIARARPAASTDDKGPVAGTDDQPSLPLDPASPKKDG
ncbi:MAG: twin-arginine translocase subunit TatB, partial [Alphaproteobacteria bacterium]|nr:twin-arginine translocase subunit TatB [Alphaproteobacteria bacterium]